MPALYASELPLGLLLYKNENIQQLLRSMGFEPLEREEAPHQAVS